MNSIVKSVVGIALWMGLVAAHADPVFQVYEFGLNAPVSELIQNLSRGKAIVSKINPGTTPILLAPVIAGEEQMTATVVIAYPTLQAYAAAATKIQASQEYGAFQASWPQDKFPVRSVSVVNSVLGGPELPPLQPGELLSILRFSTNGPAAGLVTLVQKAQSITGAQSNLIVPIVAGSRGPIVSTRHANMAAWAEYVNRIAANPKMQEFIANFPVDQYRIEFRALVQVVPIP